MDTTLFPDLVVIKVAEYRGVILAIVVMAAILDLKWFERQRGAPTVAPVVAIDEAEKMV